MWVHVGRRVIWVGICPVKYGKRGIWTLGLELMWPCQSCQREKQKPCGNIWRRSSSRLFTSIIQPTHATLFWSLANDFAFSSWSNNGGVGGEGVFVGGKQTRIPDIQSKTSAFLRFPVQPWQKWLDFTLLSNDLTMICWRPLDLCASTLRHFLLPPSVSATSSLINCLQDWFRLSSNFNMNWKNNHVYPIPFS